MFFTDSFFNTISGIFATPGFAKRRIGDDKTHIGVFKTVLFHSVSKADVFSSLVFNQHICKTDSVGFRAVFLSEQNIKKEKTADSLQVSLQPEICSYSSCNTPLQKCRKK